MTILNGNYKTVKITNINYYGLTLYIACGGTDSTIVDTNLWNNEFVASTPLVCSSRLNKRLQCMWYTLLK